MSKRGGRKAKAIPFSVGNDEDEPSIPMDATLHELIKTNISDYAIKHDVKISVSAKSQIANEFALALLKRVEIEACVAYINVDWREPRFKLRYSAYLYDIMHDLEMSKDLFTKVANNIIPPKQLANMSPFERNPSMSQRERDVINDRRNQRIEIKYSETDVCPRCHEKKVQFYEKQTKSGDEAADIKLRCDACGHHWTR